MRQSKWKIYASFPTLPLGRQKICHILALSINFFFFLFWAEHMAYRSSQAMGWIRAAAPSLHHSHVCDLHCSLQQCWILNPLSEARVQTSSWIPVGFLTCWTTTETPVLNFFWGELEEIWKMLFINLLNFPLIKAQSILKWANTANISLTFCCSSHSLVCFPEWDFLREFKM